MSRVPGRIHGKPPVSRRRALRSVAVAGLLVAGGSADTLAATAATDAGSRQQSGSGAADAAWSRRYSHDPLPDVDADETSTRASTLVPASDGDYLLAGQVGSTDAGRGWLARVDEFGALRWQTTFSARGRDWFDAAVAAPDGGALLVGGAGEELDANLDGPNRAWLVRVDAEGRERWRQRPAVDDSVTVDATSAGDGYVAVGSAGPVADDQSEALVVALGADGTTRWQRRLAPGVDGEIRPRTYASAVVEVGDGDLLVGGATGFPSPDESRRDEAWLARLTTGGETVWERTLGGSKGDRIEALVPEDGGDGAVALGNRGYSYSDDGAAWLVRIDADGETVWSRRFEREGWEWAHDLARTDTGGFAIAGARDGLDGDRRGAWLRRASADGRATWGRTYFEGDAGRAESLLAVGDGEFLLAGDAGGVAGAEAWLLDVGGEPVSGTGIPQDLTGTGVAALGIAVGLFALRAIRDGAGEDG